MADEKDAKTCGQAACNCPVEAGEKYCSASCEGSGSTIQLDCDCGHDACGSDF